MPKLLKPSDEPPKEEKNWMEKDATAVITTDLLIGLASIDQLCLLKKLFAKVYIPPIVYQELSFQSGPEIDKLKQIFHRSIHVKSLISIPPEVKIATSWLDQEKQQVVALAYQLKAILIINDRLVQDKARQLDLSICSLADLLLEAKKAGLISSVRPLLEDVRAKGYFWFNDKFLEAVLKSAGEK